MTSAYICYRCAKIFNQKIHLTNHLKRKKVCPPINMDVSAEVLLNDLVQQQIQSSSQPPPPLLAPAPAPAPPPLPPPVETAATTETETETATATATAPAAVTNHGGINIFIFPTGSANSADSSAKIISSVDFKDINTAIHSLLSVLIP